MSFSILVTYASRFGSTETIAQLIAETLTNNGFMVDCRPMDAVYSLSEYQAILLGSAVNNGHWLPSAVDFVTANQEALNQVPVALFTVHIRNTADDAVSRRNRLAYLDEVRPYLHPVSEGFFGGRFDRRGAEVYLPRWLGRFIPTTDLRNWNKVRAWANNLSSVLMPQHYVEVNHTNCR